MGKLISDELVRLSGLSEPELLKEIALGLYQQERVSEGRAMQIAQIDGMSCRRFMAERDVYHHYDIEDLEQDLATLRSLGRL